MQAKDADNKFQNLCDFVNATSRFDMEGDIFSVLTRFLPRMMDADRVSVTKLVKSGDHLEIFALAGKIGFLPVGKTIPVHESVAGKALLENRPLLANYSQYMEMADAKMLHKDGLVTGISAPLQVNGKPFGNINVASATEDAYSETSVTMMLTIASIVSAFLDRKQLIIETKDSEARFFSYSRQLEALNMASLRFATIGSEEELFEIASETIYEILPVHRIGYIVPDVERGKFVVKNFKGAGFTGDEYQSFPMSGSLLENCHRTGKPDYFPALNDSTRLECQKLTELGMKSAWAVPVQAGDRIRIIVTAGTRHSIESESDLMSVLSILGGMMSVALERLLAGDALEFQAYHDTLTGLGNRAYFNERLRDIAEDPDQTEYAFLLIDLDRFKEINDYFGHVAGDRVLQNISRWLRSFTKPGDVVARLGGDEFSMLVAGGDGREILLNQLSGLLERPQVDVLHEGRTISVRASIGVAFFPDDATDSDQLSRHADLALYEAKNSPSKKVCFFEKRLVDVFERRINLLEEFRVALETSQIKAYYQPLINLDTGKVGGLEALARWEHPTRGGLSPAGFQGVFDNRELCAALGRKMLAQVAEDIGKWKLDRVPFGRTGINFTDADFAQQGFTLNLMRELARNGLSANDIVIEVTENSILHDNEGLTLKQLQELRSAGIGVALDDFGTGYASLSHLSDVEFTSLKIDKSFTKNLLKSKADFSIVEFLTKLGKEMGFVTIAEGIETEEELQIVRQLNCKYGQGYLFAKPVPASQVPELIARLNGARRSAANG